MKTKTVCTNEAAKLSNNVTKVKPISNVSRGNSWKTPKKKTKSKKKKK